MTIAFFGSVATGTLWGQLLFEDKLHKAIAANAAVRLGGFALAACAIFLFFLCQRRWGASAGRKRSGADRGRLSREAAAFSRYSLRQLLALVLAAGPVIALWHSSEAARTGESTAVRALLALSISLVVGSWELAAYFRRSDPDQNPAFFVAIVLLAFSSVYLGAAALAGVKI